MKRYNRDVMGGSRGEECVKRGFGALGLGVLTREAFHASLHPVLRFTGFEVAVIRSLIRTLIKHTNFERQKPQSLSGWPYNGAKHLTSSLLQHSFPWVWRE